MTFEMKYLDKPDESRTFTNGEMSVVTVGDKAVGRVVLQPGWKWSNDVKPLAGTDSCEETHSMYVLSGRLHVRMDNGDEADVEAGVVGVVSAGHDAWVVGDEPFIAIDWTGAGNYAKQQ